jgi:hypothetical protein
MRDPQNRFDFDGYERLEAGMKREFADCAWLFDTADLTPEETAEQLVLRRGSGPCTIRRYPHATRGPTLPLPARERSIR